MTDIKIYNHSRNGLIDLARAHLTSGQVQLQLPKNTNSPTMEGANVPVRAPPSMDEQVGILSAHYMRVLESLSDNSVLAGQSLSRQALALQVESTIPYYLKALFLRLGITQESCNLPSEVAVAQPMGCKRSDVRGHYTAPYPVLSDFGSMQFMQHGASTLLHEIIHAMGAMKFSFREGGSSSLELRQSGLNIFQRPRGTSTAAQQRMFEYFNEALPTMTQTDFLQNFMGLEAKEMALRNSVPNTKQTMIMNGIEIWPWLEKSGLVVKNQSGGSEICMPFARYFQGRSMMDSEIVATARTASSDTKQGVVTPEQQRKATADLRDRQYVFFDSAYAVITFHLQTLAQELWPNLDRQQSRDELHATLLKAQITGNLKPLTAVLKNAFGENGGLYIKALASLNNLVERLENPHLCAFVAFVKAGQLPKPEADEIRLNLAKAILNRPSVPA